MTFNEAWPQGTIAEGPLGDIPCQEETVTPSRAWETRVPQLEMAVSCLSWALSLPERKLLGVGLYLFQVSILDFFPYSVRYTEENGRK